MKKNTMYSNDKANNIMMGAKMEEQKEIAIMEHNIQEIKAGRRKTKSLYEYKKEIEERYGKKVF